VGPAGLGVKSSKSALNNQEFALHTTYPRCAALSLVDFSDFRIKWNAEDGIESTGRPSNSQRPHAAPKISGPFAAKFSENVAQTQRSLASTVATLHSQHPKL
jgi:hypothetical protein